MTIPKNTLSIGTSAFADCTFKEVTINAKSSYQDDSFESTVKINNY